MIAKYGEPTRTIIIKELDINKEINVFEKINRIWICGKDLSMKDVISCTFSDDSRIVKGKISYETSTNPFDVFFRSRWGQTLGGDKGAIIAGNTTKTTTTVKQEEDKIYHNYTITININSLTEPNLLINLGEQGSKINEITGLLNVIINRQR